MDEIKIKKLIQQEIDAYMQNKQFNISKITNHLHNGSDSNKIPISSIAEAIPIEGSAGGVFNLDVLNTQKVNLEYTSGKKNPATVFMLPVNIIYGFGVGIHSAFEAGNAKNGTMVLFENAATTSLHIMTENGWRKFKVDALDYTP